VFCSLCPRGARLGPFWDDLAVITALALMQAAGGLDYVVSLASVCCAQRRSGSRPLALVMYVLVLASGTQHVAYALLP